MKRTSGERETGPAAAHCAAAGPLAQLPRIVAQPAWLTAEQLEQVFSSVSTALPLLAGPAGQETRG